MLILICTLGYACKERKESHINEQYLVENLEFNIDKQVIANHFDSIKIKEVIKLSVDADLPLGRIDRIAVTKDRIFILDRTFSKFLFVYDRQGNWLYKIGNKGNGPGEYITTPKDFYVDDSLKEITVFDSEIKTLYKYNWDGVLINSRILRKTWPYTFTKFGSNFYFAYKTTDTDSYLVRIEDEEENTYFKYKRLKNKRDIVSDECFFNVFQHVYFVENFNNTIVLFKNQGVEKILSIDFGKNSISKNFLDKYKGDEFVKAALSNEKATNISKIVETNKLFAFQYTYKKMRFQIVYNKNNGNYLNGISLNEGYFPSEILTCYDNYLVSALSAEFLEILHEDRDAWNTIINSAHPVVKDILRNSIAGVADDYIFIYELNI